CPPLSRRSRSKSLSCLLGRNSTRSAGTAAPRAPRRLSSVFTAWGALLASTTLWSSRSCHFSQPLMSSHMIVPAPDSHQPLSTTARPSHWRIQYACGSRRAPCCTDTQRSCCDHRAQRGTVLTARWLLTASPALQRVTHIVFLGGPVDAPAPPKHSAMRLRMAEMIESSGPFATGDGRCDDARTPREDVYGIAPSCCGPHSRYHDIPERCNIRRGSPEGGKIDWEALQAHFKVLSICGEEDVMASASTIATLLDKSTVRTMAGVGHAIPVEDPEETALRLLDRDRTCTIWFLKAGVINVFRM
ncbi:hypothetical protein OH77DRAFT_1563817, partial [Trametes cingulata]